MRSLTALLCSAAVACSSAAPAPKKPAQTAKSPDAAPAPSGTHPGRAITPTPRTDFAGLFKDKDKDEAKRDLPPGIVIISNRPEERLSVKPTTLDIASLPIADIPKPLEHKNAPRHLPNTKTTKDLRIEKIETGYRRNASQSNAVYVVVNSKLARLQIGSVGNARSASDRVYRTCGEKYYARPLLTPARWEILKLSGPRAEYRVVDAWFDAKSCTASVVKATVIRPQPVLGGLMFAFRNQCDDCIERDTVTFVGPFLNDVSASGVGGAAAASHGSFSLLTLPLKRGGSASFVGTARTHSLKSWLEALNYTVPVADVTMGVEVSHAVSDQQPRAITYATFRER